MTLMDASTDPNHKFEIIDYVIEYFDAKKVKEDSLYLIIHNNLEVISSSRLEFTKKYGLITAVFTNTKYRGLGFATKNISKIIKMAKKLKLKQLILHVDSSNVPAIKCYKKSGFEITKEKPNEYEMILKI
jgi:predicted GNAT family acetyltransferase